MKVALVHDYLNDFGGAERVLKALTEIYPNASIYTIYYKKNSSAGIEFKDKKIIESWFSNLPFPEKLISPLRFFIPFVWKNFNFSKFDLVITSASWAVTKGMKKGKNTKEICYLHTPPRYLYGYDTSRNWKNRWFSSFVQIYSHIVNHFMRMYDFEKAQDVDYFIVNSENVGKRVEKFYRRTDYKVIYPPVETSHFKNSILRGPHINESARTEFLENVNYYLTGGRLVAAKNFDLIIKAFNRLGKKLIVFGSGVEESYLKSIAKENIEFVGRVDDEKLMSLYQNAKGFIAAQKDEDFGITVVESQALGCPVIVYKAEGYLETIIENKTGVFFENLNTESLISAVKKFEKTKFKKEDLTNQAKKFSKERFKKEFKEFVNSKIK